MKKRIVVPIVPPRPTLRQKLAAVTRFAAAGSDPEHPDAGVTLVELLRDEMTWAPVPNRRMRRAAGQRSGYTRRRFIQGQMAHDIARLDAIEDDPARLAAYRDKQRLARERLARRRARREAAA